jgi:hypothetical protein
MRKAVRLWMAVIATALVSAIAAAGMASASTSVVQSRFASQARAAHLSGAQVSQIQQEVNNFIHEHGGRQVALNVVNFPGGRIEFVVPGQKYARDLATQPQQTADASGCPYEYFCAYRGGFYSGSVEEGSQMNYYYCNDPLPMYWSTEGSYINDQTDGTRAYWYGISGQVVYITPGAPASNPEVNWTPVYTIDPCL